MHVLPACIAVWEWRQTSAKTLHSALRSWTHLFCVHFACVVGKKPTTKLSPMADDPITRGGIGGLVSLVFICGGAASIRGKVPDIQSYYWHYGIYILQISIPVCHDKYVSLPVSYSTKQVNKSVRNTLLEQIRPYFTHTKKRSTGIDILTGRKIKEQLLNSLWTAAWNE